MRPTGNIPLAGNNVVRHQDDPRQTTYKFEIIGEQTKIRTAKLMFLQVVSSWFQ